MSEDDIKVPEHYRVLANALKPLIKEIQNAFVNRPVPQGVPYKTIVWSEELYTMFGKMSAIIEKLTKAVNAVPGCLAEKEDNIPESAIMQAVSSISEQLRKVINIFYQIWERPFPTDLAGGQPLASAMMEDVLSKYGSYTVQLKLLLDGQSANRFNEWLEEQKTAFVRERTIACSKSSGTRNFLLGALLGWWFGHNDK
ncbi:MAG: hypothetical protein A2077_04115 [Nitrospirae bacterium GWC2_46_6]|nr:MAG: hypothetical protein A2Z82_07865 [Nitrospirae bacterium GWA2_46_11]OGW23025.1 MAG: hypothetical protein A2077_04115 [Nitrospirae bacterium GWC2_46_6]OGW25568.1 MAG: hypothetical protein A2X55_11375 [Nitrospirae bacterium GWB2_47_37]HAK88560.1 hypothetical protein [Nitrospiraceae bacterium]